jgi:tripartite-type tricarboxylate transporter receptor subunit TctC
MRRRHALAAIAALPLGAGPYGRGRPAQAASSFPTRPLRWIVPFPPGGTSDQRVRQVAERLREQAGWSVLVDNRPGASGQIGTEAAVRAPADGHTLLLGTVGTVAINPHLFPQQPYDVRRDLQPVSQFSRTSPGLYAHRGLGVTTLAELRARLHGGAALAWASPGNATIGHLVGEIWLRRSGVTMTHVPYQGSAPAVRDFVAGQVPLLVETPAAVFEHLRSGTAVPLAVAARERLPALPQVPTFAESGYAELVFDAWQGAFTRRGVGPALLAALHREIATALRHPEVQRSHEEQANVVVASSPAEFERWVGDETARWARVVAETGVRVV